MKRAACFSLAFIAGFCRQDKFCGEAAELARQNPAAGPSITFDRVWEGYTPQSVNITVQANGAGQIHSRNPVTPPDQTEADPDYLTQFHRFRAERGKAVSRRQRGQLLQWRFHFQEACGRHHRQKNPDLFDPIRHFETAYDYSENRAIQEITNIFVGISATIEHGRKLQFLHRFDKLGLEDELKGMENAVENHNLAELQIIAPTLQSIADDTTVLNIARQRAKRLLAKAKSE